MTPVTTEGVRPKAYSYLRFSTPDQMEGDSFRRQWELAQDYAERQGLELDHVLTFHDLGVTGFRGANVERGKLSLFRRAVEDGEPVTVPFGRKVLQAEELAL
jgi:DNA invertase Pin-like site-specific DNA recombinase